ncbi:hypothetical protein XELAEV_18026710mg [Xenopus laevis]|uniref:Secreted protein n=1 Tax=Xenopus laevis TaxID=8355 RepID=A0A974CU94_XENLA|nr:hypothetical protein XELAEV_18026710mg [Xenopus laevis]
MFGLLIQIVVISAQVALTFTCKKVVVLQEPFWGYLCLFWSNHVCHSPSRSCTFIELMLKRSFLSLNKYAKCIVMNVKKWNCVLLKYFLKI